MARAMAVTMSLPYFNDYLALERGRDEAFLMRAMVHRLHLISGRRLVAGKRDQRPKRDLRHEHLAGFVLLEHAERLVFVAIDDESAFRREKQEIQHVAARRGRDERFLRIDGVGGRQRQRHDRRRRGGAHRDATVERPLVGAAVAVVRELLAALPRPADTCLVFVAHRSLNAAGTSSTRSTMRAAAAKLPPAVSVVGIT